MLGASASWDREVLARLGTYLRAGLMSDLTALRVEAAPLQRSDTQPAGNPVSGLTALREEPAPLHLIGTKPAGDVLADITAHGQVRIAIVQTGSLPLPTARPRSSLPVRVLDVVAEAGIRILRTHPAYDHDALDRADVVIGLGAGVPADAYGELDGLRGQWGAELAATRKVTDTGALAHGRQLGVTGRSVAPRLYLAIAVSGSRDHLVGVERARTIVAINHDPEAPIFQHCDFGLVADWREAVRALTTRGASRPAGDMFARS